MGFEKLCELTRFNMWLIDPDRPLIGLYMKKAQDPYLLLVPLLKAFALPDKVERATQSLRRMIYDNTKGDVLIRHNPPKGTFIIPEDIYNCFILDFVKEVAKFLAAKNQAQVNAYKICLKPTQPTKYSRHRRRFASQNY